MRSSAESAFEIGCSVLESALTGSTRRDLVDDLSSEATLDASLQRLRAGLRANVLNAGGRHVSLERIVNIFDRETRQEGFHALHDWDGRADHVGDDTIPVDVLNYVARVRAADPVDRTAVAIMIDYYLVNILALFSLRIWDDGDANRNLDRIGQLLALLQGPEGSGQLFVRDAETLILIATSHFEVQERGYDRLLDRVRQLSALHQVKIAVAHAASMGSHLRFGFEATYARDTIVMRDDNVADYPWLCYALSVVMNEYARLHSVDVSGSERAAVVESLLNGLSADARAFVGEAPPASMEKCAGDLASFRDAYFAHRADLLQEFEPFRPTEARYSPLSFFFNFSHNVLKGTIVDALLRGDPWRLTFDDLLTGDSQDGASSEQKTLLATTLMTYARLNPDRIRGQMMPVIVYDPQAGRQAFGTTMRRLRE
jgi:hypothetical protein